MAYQAITRPSDVLGNPRLPRRESSLQGKGAFIDEGPAYTESSVARLVADADASFKKVANGIIDGSPSEFEGIRKITGVDFQKAGWLDTPLMGLVKQNGQGSGAMAETVTRFATELQKLGMNPDIAKEITTGLTSGVSGTAIGNWTTDAGPWLYDLEAPSKKVFPVLTPLRNKIPRSKGIGTSHRFRRIDGISGSQTGGVANLRISMNEGTTASFRGLTLNRPQKIAYATSIANIIYRLQGFSDDITWAAQYASGGFEDLRGLIASNLLRAHMMGEEQLILHGRQANTGGTGVPVGTGALTAPSTAPTATARSAVAPETASSFTGTFYVATTFLGHFGETQLSPVATITGAASKVYDVTPGDAFPVGALGFRVYAGTVNGVATLWKQAWQSGLPAGGQDYSGGSVFVLSGTALGSGTNASAVNGTDTGTASNDDYDGILPTVAANGGVSLRVNPIANNTATLAQPLSLDLIEKQLFFPLWQNYKADPEEIWVHALESIRITDLVLGASGTPYRVTVAMGEENGVTGAYRVSRLINKVTGKEVAVTVHPYLEQGNLLALSYSLPFPYAEIPNVWGVRNVQDYLEVDWPVMQMSYDASTFAYGALVGYAPAYNGLLSGIQPA